MPLQQPQSCPRSCDSGARQECKNLSENVLLPHGMTTRSMQFPKADMPVQIVDGDDPELCWELMVPLGWVAACSGPGMVIVTMRWKTPNSRPLDISMSIVRGLPHTLRV